jgi:hypothetical protein
MYIKLMRFKWTLVICVQTTELGQSSDKLINQLPDLQVIWLVSQSVGQPVSQLTSQPIKVTDTNDGGWVLEASAYLLSRDVASQSASESWS